jgi:hypothetical protein
MGIDLGDLNDSLGAFESALSSSKVAIRITDPEVGVVLLALDGTSQDETCVTVAGEAASHLGARVVVTACAKDGISPELHAHVDRAVMRLSSAPFGLSVEAGYAEGKNPAKQILALTEDRGAGLIVTSAPFLYEYEGFGDESLSGPVDCLMAESHVPLLLVREPLDAVRECFTRMLIPMTVHSAGLGVAAGFAFKLAEKHGHVDLFAVADQQALEDADAVLGEETSTEKRSPEALLRAEQAQIGGMVSALQHRGAESDIEVHVDVVVARSLKPVLERIHSAPCLVCMPLPRDRTSSAFHRAHDIALGSRYPVLLAPF